MRAADSDAAGSFWSGLSLGRKQVVWAWTFLAVPVLFYVVIRFWPTLQAFYLSVTDWSVMRPASFVGLENYRRLAGDPLFWQVFRNTFAYLLIGTPISLVLSFVIAYYLDRVRFLHGLIRALYFLPFLTTAAAMAWVWRWFYQPVPIGLINGFLSTMGIAQQPFLRSTTQALPAVLAPAIWAGLGFQIIIFLAGLRAIPITYYEAARIDGLSEGAILRRITLPLLKPTLVFLVVFSSIGFLRIFDQVYNINTNDPGGPLNATLSTGLLMYKQGFRWWNMGYAAAIAVVLGLVILAFSALQFRIEKRRSA